MRSGVARLVIGAAITAIGVFGAENITLGTWKYDMSKSKLPGTVKARTDVREEAPDGAIKFTRTEQMADGTTASYSFVFKYDGKEYPVTGAPYDTISAKRTNEYQTSYIVKKAGGKYQMQGEYVFSRDGKTFTTKASGTDAGGRPVSTSAFGVKQ